jgi:hypothetical protein
VSHNITIKISIFLLIKEETNSLLRFCVSGSKVQRKELRLLHLHLASVSVS